MTSLETARGEDLTKAGSSEQEVGKMAMASVPEPEPPIAQGDFYVPEHECVHCGVPAKIAPDLIRHHGTAENSGSCYFYKQPANPDELKQAIAAVNASCVCAVRYAGLDPEVLSRISPESADHRVAYAAGRSAKADAETSQLVSPPVGAWNRLRGRLSRKK